jgi:hypothetical protein
MPRFFFDVRGDGVTNSDRNGLHLPSAMIARAEAARAAVDMVGDTVSDTPELVVVVRDEQGKHLFEIGALVRVREREH